MASIDAVNPLPPPLCSLGRGGITAEGLKHIDISLLSQSELQALSSCSNSAFDVRRSEDVVSPQLDRSLFNESAGSRRQTYSRFPHRSHSRLPHLHPPSLKSHDNPNPSSDPVSHSIVHFLKHFLNGNHSPPPPPPLPQPAPEKRPKSVTDPPGEVGFLGLQENLKIKRKRVRISKKLDNTKLSENGAGIELHQVNGKGEIVDFAELEKKGDDLYSEELKKRTMGIETEEGGLDFLRGLEGQWCSRRKKRKYVDAALFGEALPIGWKLLLGLRRRDYRVSVYCRRFISPTGQQFLSCKEASSFLKSHFGNNDADQQRGPNTCSIPQSYVLPSETNACPADKMDDAAHDIVAQPTLPRISSNSQENDDCLMNLENLPEVQVRDIFECFKCKLTFDEKDVYLNHLFSLHQKTTKRYKLGTLVGEGVIIKDGKYECQFCHKVFQERRSYDGHVGSHVRNTGKNSDDLGGHVDVPENPESPFQETMPSRSSKMDALIEIAQNSIFETPTIGTGEQSITDDSAGVLRVVEEVQADPTYHEANLSSAVVEIQPEDLTTEHTLSEGLNLGSQVMTEDNCIVRDGDTCNVNVKMDPICINDLEPDVSCQNQKYETSSLGVGYGNSEDHLEDTPGLTVGEIVIEDGISSVPLTQSFQLFPSFDSMSNKGEHGFSVVDQKLENVTAFEELRFDDMDPFRYGFANEQDFTSLPGSSLNLGIDSGIEDGFNSSVRFTEEVMLNTLDANQLTVCVWCRAEFKLEGIEPETLPDSIGYMCPTCKAKISGHFDGGLSMDLHNF